MEHSDFWTLFQRTAAEQFADMPAWANGAAGLTGGQRAVALMYADGWARDSFATFKAFKARGIEFVSKPLPFPSAASAADLFEAARFVPTPEGGLYRDQAAKLLAERTGGEGFVFVSSHRAAEFALSAHMGGKLDWSPEWLARGERIRRRTGAAKFYGTYARPNAAVLKAWGDDMGEGEWALASVEAVKWESGHVLIIGRSHNGFANRWLALLDPGASLFPLMPQADRDFIEAERAAERAAWGD